MCAQIKGVQAQADSVKVVGQRFHNTKDISIIAMETEKLSKTVTLITGAISLAALIIGMLLGDQGRRGQVIGMSSIALILAALVYISADRTRKGFYLADGKLKRTRLPTWSLAILAAIFTIWPISIGYILFSASEPELPTVETTAPAALSQSSQQPSISSPTHQNCDISYGWQFAITSYAKDVGWNISLMSADEIRQLTHDDPPSQNVTPSWSPDGAYIVYASRRSNAFYNLYRITTGSGGEPIQLTDDQYDHYAPKWSPNGKFIAFQGKNHNPSNWDIFVMELSSGNIQRITQSPEDELQPDWSPDSTRLVFASDYSGNYDLYVMNSDGTNITQLTNDLSQETRPAWSPDGKKILFVSNRNGTRQIFIISASGGTPIPLTSPSSNSTNPVWSRSGNNIAFISDIDGYWDPYIAWADGSCATIFRSDHIYYDEWALRP